MGNKMKPVKQVKEIVKKTEEKNLSEIRANILLLNKKVQSNLTKYKTESAKKRNKIIHALGGEGQRDYGIALMQVEFLMREIGRAHV